MRGFRFWSHVWWTSAAWWFAKHCETRKIFCDSYQLHTRMRCVKSNESAADLYRFEHCEFLDGACFDCALTSFLKTVFSLCRWHTDSRFRVSSSVASFVLWPCVFSTYEKTVVSHQQFIIGCTTQTRTRKRHCKFLLRCQLWVGTNSVNCQCSCQQVCLNILEYSSMTLCESTAEGGLQKKKKKNLRHVRKAHRTFHI